MSLIQGRTGGRVDPATDPRDKRFVSLLRKGPCLIGTVKRECGYAGGPAVVSAFNRLKPYLESQHPGTLLLFTRERGSTVMAWTAGVPNSLVKEARQYVWVNAPMVGQTTKQDLGLFEAQVKIEGKRIKWGPPSKPPKNHGKETGFESRSSQQKKGGKEKWNWKKSREKEILPSK